MHKAGVDDLNSSRRVKETVTQSSGGRASGAALPGEARFRRRRCRSSASPPGLSRSQADALETSSHYLFSCLRERKEGEVEHTR